MKQILFSIGNTHTLSRSASMPMSVFSFPTRNRHNDRQNQKADHENDVQGTQWVTNNSHNQAEKLMLVLPFPFLQVTEDHQQRECNDNQREGNGTGNDSWRQIHEEEEDSIDCSSLIANNASTIAKGTSKIKKKGMFQLRTAAPTNAADKLTLKPETTRIHGRDCRYSKTVITLHSSNRSVICNTHHFTL